MVAKIGRKVKEWLLPNGKDMKSFAQNQNVKTARYIPEQAMGTRKFRVRKRAVVQFISTATERKRIRELNS